MSEVDLGGRVARGAGEAAPSRAVSVAELRARERHAIETVGLPGVVLMENAGAGAARLLLERWPAVLSSTSAPGSTEVPTVFVLTGPGNNGGDGWVLARHLALDGVAVQVLSAVPIARLRGDAAVMARAALAFGVACEEVEDAAAWAAWAEAARGRALVVADALLGTGSGGAARPPALAPIEAFAALRASGRDGAPAVLALDVPSGLDADTGASPGAVLAADMTVTFGLVKRGLLHAAGLVGDLRVVPIGIPLG